MRDHAHRRALDPTFMKIQVIDREGRPQSIDWEPGQLLMEALRDNNLVLASCGGNCLCGTCHVWVEPGPLAKLPSRSEDEIAQLRQSRGFRADASRLSCQIGSSEELEGMRIVLAPYD